MRSRSSPPKKIAGGTVKSFLRLKGFERYIGGVILFDETLRQGTRDGVAFADRNMHG